MNVDSLCNQEDHARPFLPPLPSLVRYTDSFDDRARIVRDLSGTDNWTLTFNGVQHSLRLTMPNEWHTHLLKLLVCELIQTSSPSTTVTYVGALNRLPNELLGHILDSIAAEQPSQFRERWILDFHGRLRPHEMRAVRSLASAAGRLRIGEWTPADRALVRGLPGTPLDKYARVRDGRCFLPLSAQSEIVGFIDEVADAARRQLAEPVAVSLACMLALTYQYGLRPGQIARIRPDDLRFFPSGAVHISISLLKQRGDHRGRTVTRSIQREWCALFRHLFDLGSTGMGEKLFGRRPTEVTKAISDLIDEITGRRFSPGDLRHTAALRLVDGGASRDEVSEFLGHTDITAVEVYYDSSAKQAELTNAALGLSDIYRNVVKVARTRTIDPALLGKSPADQQVAGVPHGVPITGIGLCRSGQSLCQRNPVLACYTCHKFLPVSDVGLHDAVLASMRNVVKGFERPNDTDRAHPPMLQLRSTLEAVQRLVVELTQKDHENDQ